MSTIQSINAICRNVVQRLKTFEVTISPKGLEMTWIKNDPYAQSFAAVVKSKMANTDISDKTIHKLQSMYNGFVFRHVEHTDNCEYFVGVQASEKVKTFDIKQNREDVLKAQPFLEQCKPKVRAKLETVLYQIEEKLGHMEHSRMQVWNNKPISPENIHKVMDHLGGNPAVADHLSGEDWAPQARAKFGVDANP